MDPAQTLHDIAQSLGSTATVKSVFGEPISAEGKTVVPVAKVAYGFGAGGGSGRAKRGEGTPNGAETEGGGGGGGVRAYPAGALEISAAGTRFISLTDFRLLGVAFAAGALLGGLLLRRRS